MSIFTCLTHYKYSVRRTNQCINLLLIPTQGGQRGPQRQWNLQPAAGLEQADQSGSAPIAPPCTFSPFCWQTGQFESQMWLEKEESRTDILCSTCGIGLRADASLRSPGEAISALIAWRWVNSIPLRSRILSANTWPRRPHPAKTRRRMITVSLTSPTHALDMCASSRECKQKKWWHLTAV